MEEKVILWNQRSKKALKKVKGLIWFKWKFIKTANKGYKIKQNFSVKIEKIGYPCSGVQQHLNNDCNMQSNESILRGGVEDTRLEAKVKDTKKIRGQGQGQPFRGQTLSRPRTGMLEAKAKDQEHKRKSSPKKKGLHKSFSGDLRKKKKKKGLHKNFSSDLHEKTFSKKFFKRSTKF